MDDLIGEFITETTESLDVLDRELARPDLAAGSAAMLGDVLKLLHAIKGTCGFLGLPRLESLADAGERMLAKLRNGRHALDGHALATVRDMLRSIRALMDHLAEHGREPAGNDAGLIYSLQQFDPVGGPAPSASIPAKASHAPTTMLQDAPRRLEPLRVEPAPMLQETEETKEIPQTTVTLQPASRIDTGLVRLAAELVGVRNRLAHLLGARPDREYREPLRQLGEMIRDLRARLGGADGIAPIMLVETAGQWLALPQDAVVELIRIGADTPHRVEKIHTASVLRLRGALLPLVVLGEWLKLSNAASGEEGYVAVLRTGGMEFGVAVDAVGATEEIAIAPVNRVLASAEAYAGAGVLGDGRTVMLLDTARLAAACGAPASTVAPMPEPLKLPRQFLVFQADGRKALPLAQIARLDTIAAQEIERLASGPVVRYRGNAMRLVTFGNQAIPAQGRIHAIALRGEGRRVGFVAETIIGVGEAVATDASGTHPISGHAVIDGEITELVDAAYFLNPPHEQRVA